MTEIASRADFSRIRYAQCWEDADVLLRGLEVKPGGHYLSIASAGDNSFSLLAAGAARVVAVDMNPAQAACVELRRAAYEKLEHEEFLQLMGARECQDRAGLFSRCAEALPSEARTFWQAHAAKLAQGCGGAGKFENYFRLFRDRALPLAHNQRRVHALLEARSKEARHHFYENTWNTWRWRALFKIFFSRAVMGRMGRSPEFFKYVEGKVADRILARTRHALTELEPSQNPYLHWILTGTHGEALPHAWRPENYAIIRERAHCLEMHTCSVEEFLNGEPTARFDGFNLSDIFEYMSEAAMEDLYEKLLMVAKPGARLVYWNMLAPRECPARFSERVRQHVGFANELLRDDKAFFYSALRVEEVIGNE